MFQSEARLPTVLLDRPFRRFWLASAFSDIALNIWFLVTAWLVLQATDSPTWVGLVLGINAVPAIGLSLLGGVAADRLPRIRLIQLGMAGFALVALVSASAVQTGISSPSLFLALSLAIGVIYAFEAPAAKAVVVDLVGKHQLVSANALNELAEFTGEIAAPLLVSGLLVTARADAAYWIGAVALMVATGLIFRVQVDHPNRIPASRPALAELIDGIKYGLQTPPYSALLVVATTAIFGSMIVPLVPVYARDVLGVGGGGYGVLAAALGAGLATGSVLLTLIGDVQRKSVLMLVALMVANIGIASFGFSRSYPLSAVLLFTVGFGSALGGNMLVTLFQTQAQDAFRGRVMSLYTLTASTFPLGTLVGGWLASTLGLEITLLLAAIGGTVLVVVAFARSPVLRQC